MLNTIILFAIAIVGITYLLKLTRDLKLSNVIIVLLSFALFFVLLDKSNNYKDGYNDAIREATLVETTDEGYFIEFNGEIHEYSFD